MSVPVGTHKLGPDNATLHVRTKKAGAASMAGHNLLIEVTSWDGALEVGEGPAAGRVELSADAGSFRVLEGTGGAKSLDDGDKASIKQTIDEEVLKRLPIEFRSTAVERLDGAGRLGVRGELQLAGQRAPVGFELSVGDDGTLSGSAIVKQSDWGIKPYSALFGTLKVVDEVTIEIAGKLG